MIKWTTWDNKHRHFWDGSLAARDGDHEIKIVGVDLVGNDAEKTVTITVESGKDDTKSEEGLLPDVPGYEFSLAFLATIPVLLWRSRRKNM